MTAPEDGGEMGTADRRLARIEAAAGAGLWAVLARLEPFAASGTMGRIHLLLSLAILVVVPLLLSVLLVPRDAGWPARALRVALRLQPIAAACVIVSFFIPSGTTAAILAAPWGAFTVLIALSGLGRVFRRRPIAAEEIAIDLGCIYLPVGALWLLASRAGLAPLGFGDPIAILTAVHFHFAGFAAPVITGLLGRRLRGDAAGRGRTFTPMTMGVVAGMPLVAAGITASPHVEIAGVAVFGVSLLALAGFLLLRVAPTAKGLAARGLFALSALSLIAGILLAALYGAGEFAGAERISIPRMVLTHGWLMGFGFALLGGLGFALEGPPERSHG